MIIFFSLGQCLIKQNYRIALAMLMIGLCLSSLYAGNYHFSKLSALAKQRYGDQAFQSVTELNQIIVTLHNGSDSEKLKAINGFFNNNIAFVDDLVLWKQSDYWATPLESIGMQAGDCEDYSIAKYLFLKVLNIPNEKLRLTYVRAQLFDGDINTVKAHMVLSYYATPSADPLILDNLNPDILPASRRPDLSPIFSFNDKGLWVGGSNQPKASAQNHLSKWRNVLSRAVADGIE